MRDSADPAALARAEPDSRIAQDALRLWESLHEAESAGFLARPVELTAPRLEPQFAAGQCLLGRFVIQSLLGVGGMGEVYLALDRSLNEPVAVKTIRAHLAADPAVRQRFLAEVQNARRITHPNVCRINDLFEDSGLPFLSMEYLEGDRLSTWIEDPRRLRSASRAVAIQLAEGLAAAHRAGILHCDFKPANVIVTGSAASPRAVITDLGLARALRAAEPSSAVAAYSLLGGTLEFMAPELLAGGQPGVASDIFAYGRVLALLMPGQRMAARCQAARAQDRPASLEIVSRSLRGDFSRRLYLGAGIATAAAAATYALAPRAGLPVGARTRVAINNFRGSEPAAALFRELLTTALRQSARLTVVADDHLRSLLKSHGQPPRLPADRTALALVAASGGEIALVIEGVLAAATRSLRVSLQIYAPAAPKPALSLDEQVSDPRNIVRLADQTALRLRREFGESAAALRAGAGYTPLEQVTSESPEAVECYFRGMREHENANATGAVTWFDQAVRLDPNFALAWLQRGVSLMGYRLADSFDSFQRAFALRSRVTERERLWIETRCFNIANDWDSALNSCLRLITLFPEEANFQRETAFQLTRLGRPREALSYNQRAADLDSTNVNNLSEWIVNNTSANLYDEALTLYRRFRDGGETNKILNWGAGLALMGKDEFDAASDTFADMANRPDLDRYARRLQCGPLILSGRLQRALSILSADVAWDATNGEQTELNHRRVWLGMLEWLLGAPAKAREHGREIARLEPLPSSLQPLRETGLLALFLGDSELLAMLVDRLRAIELRWPSSHTQGARAALEAAAIARTDPSRAASLFDSARGLRPDPLSLYPAALWHIENHRFDSALDLLTELENQRGRIHRMYFPGLSTIVRIDSARCLARLSRFVEALRHYDWIVAHWENSAGRGLIAQVRLERQQLIRNTKDRR
jgi:tetratricopeptide (TPR) repeat protein